MTYFKDEGCLTAAQWAQYLQPLAIENEHWQHHLERCDACRSTLAGLAGDETWWEETARWLEPGPEHHLEQFVSRVTQSVCALSSDLSNHERLDPLCDFEISQLQHLLTPASHPELLGRIGRYELEQLVGRGGMGLVFRARDIELRRVVAVKTLAIHLIPIASARERFIREARASAGLVHPHIVPVYDVITDGPIPAIVMQFVAGPTLAAWLSRHGKMEWTHVLQIAQQLSDALIAAHANGLIHRDVKPGNVLLEADGSRALLTDFGLVRTLDEATLTRSGMLAGTPDYMSPEQARGEPVTHSSDLFSLGALLYAMLTGHPPFRAGDPMSVLNKICHARLPNLATTHPEIPVELCRLVDKLLTKDPRRRYPSAADLRTHLQRLAQAPLHLSQQRTRSVFLRVASGTLAVMLLAVVTWMLFMVASIGRNTARDFPGPSGQADQYAGREQSTAWSVPPATGFADVSQFDRSLRLLDKRVQLLDDELSSQASVLESSMQLPSTMVDRRLEQVDQVLTRLEQEMSATAERPTKSSSLHE